MARQSSPHDAQCCTAKIGKEECLSVPCAFLCRMGRPIANSHSVSGGFIQSSGSDSRSNRGAHAVHWNSCGWGPASCHADISADSGCRWRPSLLGVCTAQYRDKSLLIMHNVQGVCVRGFATSPRPRPRLNHIYSIHIGCLGM